MKRVAVVLLAALAVLACVGCGSQKKESKYAQALDVLSAVEDAYEEGDRFAIYGGDQEHAVMDAPGTFDVTRTEEMGFTLGLPQSQFSNVEDAASMIHMMNANTFTGAAYRLKDGTDVKTFADEAKDNILATQWMCGIPDTLLIVNVDGTYVITAYGEAGIMETLKNNAISVFEEAEILVETPVS